MSTNSWKAAARAVAGIIIAATLAGCASHSPSAPPVAAVRMQNTASTAPAAAARMRAALNNPAVSPRDKAAIATQLAKGSPQ